MSPDLRERIALTESAACVRTRLVSTLNLNTVVRTLLQVMEDFLALAKDIEADPARLADAAYIRASVHARKAAWLLHRLARITPIDESALRRATGCLPASASSSSLPSQPVHPAGALRDLPLASSLNDDANSLRMPLVPVESATAGETEPVRSTSATTTCPSDSNPPVTGCAMGESASAPASSSPSAPSSPRPSAALRVESASPSASDSPLRNSASSATSAFSSPSPLDSLLSNLEHLASTLGIDISDLDDPDNPPPIPPEFLATLPPELAALLAPDPPEPHQDPDPPDPDPPNPSQSHIPKPHRREPEPIPLAASL